MLTLTLATVTLTSQRAKRYPFELLLNLLSPQICFISRSHSANNSLLRYNFTILLSSICKTVHPLPGKLVSQLNHRLKGLLTVGQVASASLGLTSKDKFHWLGLAAFSVDISLHDIITTHLTHTLCFIHSPRHFM